MNPPEQALAELFQQHRQGLAGAVRSVLGPGCDPAEVLQDAFLKCWRSWQAGTAPHDPVGWMFVVTWNVAKDALRRSRRRRERTGTEAEMMTRTTEQAAPDAVLAHQEQVAHAQAAIAGLDDGEKQVFLLRVGAELSFEGVAAALGIPVGTAKTRMRSALQRLRQRLGVRSGGTEVRQ